MKVYELARVLPYDAYIIIKEKASGKTIWEGYHPDFLDEVKDYFFMVGKPYILFI